MKIQNITYKLATVLIPFLFVITADAQAVTFSDTAICKATLSLVMNQKPSIIKAKSVGNEVFVRYERPYDGKSFEYKCLIKQSENKVVWAAKFDYGWGRWRDGPHDAVISYQIEGKNLIVDEGGHSKKFKASELGN